jgi:hypothetical protein
MTNTNAAFDGRVIQVNTMRSGVFGGVGRFEVSEVKTDRYGEAIRNGVYG